MSTIYFVNGEYVNKENAFVHVNDIGLLRGYAVFDYLKTYFGKPFHLQDHLRRLHNSAKLIGLEIPYPVEEITSICHELLVRNNFKESNIRIVVTGGVGEDSKTKGKPVLIITCEPRLVLDEKFYTEGIKIKAVQGKRDLSFSKTCNYIRAVDYLSQYKKDGFNEVLYVLEGGVLECTSSNIFIIINNKVFTPKTDILYGITRKVIMDICSRIIDIQEKDIMLEEAYLADEVFISSTEREVMPVVMIDDRTISNGKVGQSTQRIRDEFHRYVDSKVWCD